MLYLIIPISDPPCKALLPDAQYYARHLRLIQTKCFLKFCYTI